MNKESLVSVVLVGEASPPEQINHFITQIVNEQTHKNLDILVVTIPRDDLESLQDEWNEKASGYTIRFLEAAPGLDLVAMGADSAMGEVVFYKSCGGSVWYPRHIEVHLEEFNKDKKAEWALSHIEKRDGNRPQEFLNALGWRIDVPPKIEEIILDEICHKVGLKVNWASMMKIQEGRQFIVPGMILRDWTKNNVPGIMPSEITVVLFEAPRGPENIAEPARKADEIIEGMDEHVGRKQFPTIVGNSQYDTHNHQVWDAIKDYQPKKIAIKRTIGMGDVVQVEPIIRALKEKYNNAHITFFTSKTRSCIEVAKHFEGVDELIGIEEKQLIEDVLSMPPPETENIIEKDNGDLDVEKVPAWVDDFELKFDLDLAYESRIGSTFIGGYCHITRLSEDEMDKPKLTFTSERPNNVEKYVILCNEGSGWQGKEWDKEGWKRMGKIIQKLGYTIIETAQNSEYHLFENSVKTDGSIEQFLQYCQHASAYLGADNGVMHTCATFDIPCFVVAGAAVPSKTYPKGDIYEVTADNEFVGIKHKFFYRLDGPMFVPPNQEKCFDGLTIETVEEHFNKFIKTKRL